MDVTNSTRGKGFHIAHLNVRSMFGGNKFDVLRTQISKSNADIFTISESWLTAAIPDSLIEMTRYSVARLDRSWSNGNIGTPKKGGGLACFVKNGIKFSESRFRDLNASSEHLEMQWLAVTLKRVRPITIVNIYRPPQGKLKSACKLISEAFEKANMKDNTDIFVLGDFNVNFKDTKSASYKELSFTMQSLGLSQQVRDPTRLSWSNGVNTSSMIDLIFTNSDSVAGVQVLDMNVSDHLAVLITRKKLYSKPAKINFTGRSYRNYNKEDFQERLGNANWVNYYALTNPNALWYYLKKIILDTIDPMCPLKKFRVPEAKEPWITNEALEAIRDKDRLMARARKSKLVDDWNNAKTARNTVGREIQNLRAEYLKDQQVMHKADPKKFWNTIASIVPSKKKNNKVINLKLDNIPTYVEQEEVAPTMNTYFSRIGPNLAVHHNTPWKYFGEREVTEIEDIETDLEEVILLCREIETLKSSGIDNLSSRICKDAFLALPEQLIFNCSLATGIFPDQWKAAKVVPLFKGGDRENVENYRPVSLLPLPGKILEKIVHSRLTDYFGHTNFISENQGGFRKGFSTTSIIADLTDDLFVGTNNGLTTLAAFIDLKKAFDTVDTDILLRKLELAGIRDTTLQWCHNYLTNRSQRTIANNITSTSLPITCGVPQGSVLGPLFFLVFINDLEFALTNCKFKLYADDSVLYQSGLNGDHAANLLQPSLDEFSQWCNVNKLTINTKKSKLMIFGSRSKVKKAKHVNAKLNGVLLQKVPSYKYLGLILDPTLSYNKHVSYVIKTVLFKVMMLAKLRKYLNDNVALLIYKSMLLPYFDYADVIFSNTSTGDLDKLQRLQNKCLRLCNQRIRNVNTARLHKTTKVPFLKDRCRAHVLNFMYIRKSKPGLLNVREIRTRAHDGPLFNVPIPRCEAFKRSVVYFGSVEWNNLNAETRNMDAYLPFKFLRKKEMLAQLDLIN